ILEKTRKELAEIKKSADELNKFTENVIDSVREPLLAIDKDLRVIKASRSFYNFFMVTAEETIGKLIYELGNHQWDIPKLKELLEKIIPEKNSFDNYEVEHSFSTIGRRVMHLNARQVKRAFGKEKIILLAIEDITERKGKEDILKETHRATSDFLNILLNHMHAPIIVWDTSMIIKRFNRKFEELSGYDSAEVINKKIDFLFPKDKIDTTLELLKNHLTDEQETVEIPILTKENSVKTVLWSSSRILDEEGKNIIATISQDITNRKRLEDTLNLLETRYRRLFESAKDGIIILDAETGKIVDVNPFLIDLLGYTKNELIEKSIWEIGVLQDIYENKEKFLELQQKEYVRYDDLPLVTSDGREIHVGFVSNVYLANNKKVIQCNIRDNTENWQIKKQIIESEEKFRGLAENTSDVILIMDLQGTITYMSRMKEDRTGYTRDYIEGVNIQKILTPESYNMAMDILQKQLRGENINAPFEVGIVNKTGKVFPFELNVSVITDNGELKGIQIVARDITERKQAEMIKQMQYNIAYAVITVKNLNELFDSVKNELNTIIDAKNFVIALYNEETGMLSANVERDEKDEIPVWPAEKSLTGYVIKQNRPVLLRKNEILRLHEEGIIELFGTISEAWLGVPLKVEGKMLGAIVVQNYDNPDVYDQTSIEILEIVAHELSIFIDRQRSGENANKLFRAVEQSSVSVVITNREGRIEYVNPFFTEQTGYSFEEAKGENPSILKSGHHSTAFYQELWDTILSGKDWEGEMLNKKKNGEFYWDKAFISPIVNNEGVITTFVAIKEDITERKKMIEELVTAKEKAEESDRLKTAFLNNISHEIRTPMNAIVGFSGILNDPGLLPEKRKQFTDMIIQSSDQLLAIIDDIISIASIEAGQKEIQQNEININLRCKLLKEQFFHKANDKNVTLSLKTMLADDEAFIITDATKLTQILNNLIGNALKFTPQGYVNFGYGVKDNQLEFYIEDSGIGIPLDMQELIFYRFRQVETTSKRNFGGSGLGLSISKAYVELLGGNIWLTSELGKGSTFYFTIPYKKANQEKSPDIPSNMDLRFWIKTLLIAEDEDSNFMLLEELLSEKGIDIMRAANGVEAVELCKSSPNIDLVLMDLKMPVMDGYEATTRIKEFRPDLCIIAQTAYSTEVDRNKALAGGCSDFISKPINKELLLSTINEQFHN
ncbi:MAG: PAS domain S-box protein, partial [Bacteroidales bacterium]